MKFRAFKKCENFVEIYTKEQETKGLQIELDGLEIFITEHQFGRLLKEPYVEITIEDTSYCMDLSQFIKKISI